MNTIEVTVRPIGRWKHVSDVVWWGMTDRGSLRVFFPTRDRRKARRVARKLNIRFKRGSDGYMEFR